MFERASRWSGDGNYIGGGPTLDSGYKNWELCAHGSRVESHPPLFSLPRWGPAALTGASGCSSCSGTTTYNGSPKTAGLGLQLAPPHDLTGDPGLLPPSPTDHPFVLADTGEVVYTETDFVIKGTGFDFVFSRTYRSAIPFEGWVGYGWSHSAEIVMIEETNGDLRGYFGDGRVTDYYDYNSGTGDYTSPDGHYDLLESGTRGSGHTPTEYANMPYFTKTEKNGVVWEFDLGNDGAKDAYVCTKISDPWGNEFTFKYNTTDGIRLDELTAPDGQVATFTYDTAGELLERIVVSDTSTDAAYGNLQIDYSYDATYTDMLVTVDKHKTRQVDGGTVVRPYTTYDYWTSGIAVKNLKYVIDSSTDTAEAALYFEYETTGTDRCKKVTHADGEVHQYAFDQTDATDDWTKYTDPSSQRRDFVYTDLSVGDRVIKEVREHLEDKAGADLTGTYKLKILRECDCGRITSLEYPDGSKEEWDYDANGNVEEYRRIGTGATGTLRKTLVWGSFASHCRLASTSGWIREEATPGTKVTYTWNGTTGLLEKVAWPSVSAGQPSSQTIEWIYSIASDGTLSSIKDPEGNQTDYDWVGDELTITAGTNIAAEERVVSVTGYDEVGNVESRHGPYGGATDLWSITVTMDGRVLKAVGAEGEEIKHEYDLQGRRTKTTQKLDGSSSLITDITVSTGGRVTEVKRDSAGINAITTYDLEEADADRYSKTMDPDDLGRKSKWGYGSYGLAWKEYRLDDRTSTLVTTLTATLERDTMGRVTKRVGRDGDTSYGYDGYGRRTSVTEDYGSSSTRLLTLTLKDWGAVASETVSVSGSDKAKRIFHYDEAIRHYKTVQEDVVTQSPSTPLADIAIYEVLLDKNGRASAVTDPGTDADRTRLWTSAGDLKKDTGGIGNIVEYSYDDSARTVTVTHKDWNTSTSTTPNSYVAVTTYDKSGRTDKITDKGKTGGSGRVTDYTYDVGGRLISLKRPGGADIVFEYDLLSRRTKETADVEGATTAVTDTTFSTGGRMTSVKDANGEETWWEYNAFDQEEEVKYTVDLSASLAADKYSIYTRTYATDGRLDTLTDPEGGVLTYFYDDGGRLDYVGITMTGTDLVGPDRIDFGYDELDRITSGKTQSESGGSYTDITSVTRAYDAHGRMSSETQYGGWVMTYDTHDDAGRITKMTLPSGGPVTDIEYVYDDAGRPETVKRKLNGGSTTTVAALDYEGYREIKRVQAPFDLTREQTWTDYREPDVLTYDETSTSSLLTGFDYTWDTDGRMTLRERKHDIVGSDIYGEVYRYDDMDRLTKYWTNVKALDIYHTTDPTTNYTDAVVHTIGKVYERTKKEVTPSGGSTTTTNYTVNDGYQITDIGATSRSWDHNGQLTNDGTWKYEWTVLGQLHRAYDHLTLDDRVFTYDAFGRRVETKVGTGTPVEYLYHGWHMIGEHDGTRWLWQEVPMPVGEGMLEHHGWDGSAHEALAVQEDFQSTVWALSDTTGAIYERYVQDDPYGMTHTLNSSDADIGDYASGVHHKKRMHGGVVDEILEFYDFRNRWLEPETGAWLSRDPLGYVDMKNLYQALLASPTAVIDPFGESSTDYASDLYKCKDCPYKFMDVDAAKDKCAEMAADPSGWSKKCIEKCAEAKKAGKACTKARDSLRECVNETMDREWAEIGWGDRRANELGALVVSGARGRWFTARSVLRGAAIMLCEQNDGGKEDGQSTYTAMGNTYRSWVSAKNDLCHAAGYINKCKKNRTGGGARTPPPGGQSEPAPKVQGFEAGPLTSVIE